METKTTEVTTLLCGLWRLWMSAPKGVRLKVQHHRLLAAFTHSAFLTARPVGKQGKHSGVKARFSLLTVHVPESHSLMCWDNIPLFSVGVKERKYYRSVISISFFNPSQALSTLVASLQITIPLLDLCDCFSLVFPIARTLVRSPLPVTKQHTVKKKYKERDLHFARVARVMSVHIIKQHWNVKKVGRKAHL